MYRRGIRTCLMIATLAVVAGVPVSGTLGAPNRGTAARRDLVPAAGSLFGAYVKPDSFTQDGVKAAVGEVEAQIGRTLDVDHHFYGFTDPFPGWKETWDLASDRTSMMTWGPTQASELVSGAHDSLIAARADGVKALGAPVFLRFFAEMNGINAAKAESPAAYVAAWRHVHDLFVARGATNAVWVWCPTAWGFEDGSAAPYYPGDAYVDWICADGYNWAPGQAGAKWRSVADIFDGFYRWGLATGKPMMIGETGCQERADGEKAAWLDAGRQALKEAFPAIRAFVYFDANPRYDWRISTSASATAAFVDMAADPWFDSRSAAPDTTPPGAPNILSAAAPTSSSVVLAWSGATDNIGVTGYDVYRDGSLLTRVGPVGGTTDDAVAAGGTYTYAVRARDAAGNVSVPSPQAVVSVPPGLPDGIAFQDGFETGDLSKWSTMRSVTVQKTYVWSGTWAVRASGGQSAAYARAGIGSSEKDVYYAFRFKVLSKGRNRAVLGRVLTANGSWIAGVFVDKNGILHYRNDVSDEELQTSVAVTKDVWHVIELHVTANGASGKAELWYDGSRIMSRTDALGTTGVSQVQVGDSWGHRSYDVAFDQVTLATRFVDRR